MRAITHDNLCLFVGLCNEPCHVSVLTKFCLRGSLQDILNNHDIKLDDNFKRSFICDCIQGLDYLHKSPIKSHGRMRSNNCLVDSRWVVKLSAWGLACLHGVKGYDSEEERWLLWTAPELLNNPNPPQNGTPLADIYSLGIIFQEILYRCLPYQSGGGVHLSAVEIVTRVKNLESPPFRPKLPENQQIDVRYLELARDCWREDKNTRPLTARLQAKFNSFNKGKINIMDNMLKMMEKYANNLEEIIGERTRQLEEEKKKADMLLYRMLPASVADSLKLGLHINPEIYKESSIYFSDIVSFTTLASESTPMEVVDFLNDLWTTFDDIIDKYNVYKVETIGDAYLVVSGVPKVHSRHAPEIANMSLDILAAVKTFKIRHRPDRQLKIRIGMHSGPVVAGVVGQTMPRYCLFGDTVNTASRMESHGVPLKIHISEAAYKFLLNAPDGYIMELRGEIEIKGKGLQLTYFLEGRNGEK
ncbi:hypothetical protein HELRODRAFT_88195 [Helobdella robusta]|uniref:Guanylate cyclase n=1 Tax=Helobdella robusta TaxID=6412 RepID=T1G6Z7_HELRO|nr:hypothetical protein HELRODRAFT_88195 [Helobdella robusta]ESN93770.1 hypothetical protein HELRODRAFT_88195 [Helobdella robusta]